MSYALLFVAGALVIVVFELLRSVGAYHKFRGDRIISCPKIISLRPCVSQLQKPPCRRR